MQEGDRRERRPRWPSPAASPVTAAASSALGCRSRPRTRPGRAGDRRPGGTTAPGDGQGAAGQSDRCHPGWTGPPRRGRSGHPARVEESGVHRRAGQRQRSRPWRQIPS